MSASTIDDRCDICDVDAEERTCDICGHTATVIDCAHHRQPAEVAADENGRPVCDDHELSEMVMLTVIDGETDADTGVDLNRFGAADLPSILHNPVVWSWFSNHGYTEDNTTVWVLVEPEEDAGGRVANQIAARDALVTRKEMATVRAEIAEQEQLRA